MQSGVERGDAALAIEAALTEQERSLILGKFKQGNLNGAAVADILDILSNHDALLPLTEPFYEDGASEVARGELGWPTFDEDDDRWHGSLMAMAVYAIALLAGRVPEPGEVVRLVRRA